MTKDNDVDAKMKELLETIPDSAKEQLFELFKKYTDVDAVIEVTDPNEQSETSKRKQTRHKPKASNDSLQKIPGPKKLQKVDKGKRGQSKKQACRQEPIAIGKQHNIFNESADKTANKADTNIDKLLWKGREPTTRLTRKEEFVTAVCTRCEYEFADVPFSQCYVDDEGLVFVCEGCSIQK